VERDARQEAEDAVGGRYAARVLEPSPPPVLDPPWFADDPVARGVDPAGRPIVSPVATGDVRWSELAAGDATLHAWCQERWLVDRPLDPPPPGLAAARDELHRVSAEVLSPARAQAPGAKIGLRWTLHGFGTPFFGDGVQLRVDGAELVRQTPQATVREPLDVDAAASRWLGDLFGFATSVLEELRAEAGPGDEPDRVQLWPEHFDVATVLGPEAAGRRATYGVSPGDTDHPGPYAYVSTWAAPPADPALWNATAFPGAELSIDAILAAPDQRAALLTFLRDRRDALRRTG
jgi:hypothetical protein